MESKEEPIKEKYPGSVLLSDHIKNFVENGELIVEDPWYEISHDPAYENIKRTFDDKCLDRAKYNVRLGITYFQNSIFRKLDEKTSSSIIIKPYELIFVESYEVFKMPPNVVAVYDLRIKNCLCGLGLQTGLQLDPTYYGRFFCPVFNFSDTEVELKYKDQLASIQFLYTTFPTKKTNPFKGRNNLFCLIQSLSADRPRSGMQSLREEILKIQNDINKDKNDIKNDISNFENKRVELVNKFTELDNKVERVTSSNFSAMAFIIGALAVVVSAVSIAVTRTGTGANIALAVAMAVIIGLIGLDIIFHMKTKKQKKNNKNNHNE